MSLTKQYNSVPVIGRLGSGRYTYKFVIDAEILGIRKWEIFADTVEQAVMVISNCIATVVGWSYINNDTITLNIPPYQADACILYQ